MKRLAGISVHVIARPCQNPGQADFVQTADATFDGAPAADAAAMLRQLITAERSSIARQFVAGKLQDAARRRIERELDLADSLLRHAADSATAHGFGES